jgi:hypothetical protein
MSPAGELPDPRALVAPPCGPDTVEGWKALAQDLLTARSCALHRNVEISARYAWINRHLPACFKWAGMAAIASHRVRLALFPLRLHTSTTGTGKDPRNGRHRRMLLDDIETIRATNDAIYDDIFWAHLAYVSADDGIGRLRILLGAEPRYTGILVGFEAMDRARSVLEDDTAPALARVAAQDLVWKGNVVLLEHEQRALVQPHLERLSCASARLLAMGAATTFEVRGVRNEATYFTSFYSHSLTRGLPSVLRTRTWPRITRFDHRWEWIVNSVVPRFRNFDADPRLMNATLRRIIADAGTCATTPCMSATICRR